MQKWLALVKYSPIKRTVHYNAYKANLLVRELHTLNAHLKYIKFGMTSQLGHVLCAGECEPTRPGLHQVLWNLQR